jgi:hypothetical protein
MNKRDFKTIIVSPSLSLVLFLSILFVFIPVSVNAQAAKIFENKVLGARVPYPEDWNIEEEGLIVTFKSPNGAIMIKLVGVGTVQTDSDLDLEEFVTENLFPSKRNGDNFQLLDNGLTSINDKDYYSWLLRIQSEKGAVVRDLNLITEEADSLYLFKLQSLDDLNNRELSDQLYTSALTILQQMIMSAELAGIDVDSLEEGTGENGGDDFNPFERGPDGQDGGFGGQNPGGSGGNDNGSDAFPPQQQQPSPSEPLCGPGSCIIS